MAFNRDLGGGGKHFFKARWAFFDFFEKSFWGFPFFSGSPPSRRQGRREHFFFCQTVNHRFPTLFRKLYEKNPRRRHRENIRMFLHWFTFFLAWVKLFFGRVSNALNVLFRFFSVFLFTTSTQHFLYVPEFNVLLDIKRSNSHEKNTHLPNFSAGQIF